MSKNSEAWKQIEEEVEEQARALVAQGNFPAEVRLGVQELAALALHIGHDISHLEKLQTKAGPLRLVRSKKPSIIEVLP